MTDWKANHPYFAEAIDPVSELVTMSRNISDCELEARLGTLDALGHFKAGVARADIDRMMDMMQNSSHMQAIGDEWIEEQDFFYSQDGKNFRTRVQYDSALMTISPTTVSKTTIGKCDLGVERGEDDTCIRISQSETAKAPAVPPVVTPVL